jgi:hypothetical protein
MATGRGEDNSTFCFSFAKSQTTLKFTQPLNVKQANLEMVPLVA